MRTWIIAVVGGWLAAGQMPPLSAQAASVTRTVPELTAQVWTAVYRADAYLAANPLGQVGPTSTQYGIGPEQRQGLARAIAPVLAQCASVSRADPACQEFRHALTQWRAQLVPCEMAEQRASTPPVERDDQG